MTSMLVINFDNGKSQQFLCPCIKICPATRSDIAYAYKHASSLGWIFTSDLKYSKDGTQVAVCPECAAKENWEKS